MNNDESLAWLNELSDEQLDYKFLLLAHIAGAEQQISTEKSKELEKLAEQAAVGLNTIQEMEKILWQEKECLSVEEIALQIPSNQQKETVKQMLNLASVDGFLSPLEIEVVTKVTQSWNWSPHQVKKYFQKSLNLADKQRAKNRQNKISLGASLIRGFQSILPSSIVESIIEQLPEDISRKIESLQREILLGPEYYQAVDKCSLVAKEDYQFAHASLNRVRLALGNLEQDIINNLKKLEFKTHIEDRENHATAKVVAEQLENSRSKLKQENLQEIAKIQEFIKAKQRALNYFSIAFVGKTKAGKSTLHAIITGEGWEEIGKGKQRTTRLNRVYEWKNIRIIDTPGIGAPDGKTDEEIAESIIDESDIICYLVTNDSIQETEFQFLRLLKEKTKPLIIILNIKNNLRDNRRLGYFLDNPHKLFAMEGENGLRGHIERIRQYAKQYYTNDYFEIVPVMLLAAQISYESNDEQLKDKLLKTSLIESFLDNLRESLITHGTIRRSQTLLGSTVIAIEKPKQWIENQIKIYQELIPLLQEKRRTMQQRVKEVKRDRCEAFKQEIDSIFYEVNNSIIPFAKEYWKSDKSTIETGWENQLKIIKYNERLQNVYTQTSEQLSQELQEVIAEVGKEINFVSDIKGFNIVLRIEENKETKNNFLIDFVHSIQHIFAILSPIAGGFVLPSVLSTVLIPGVGLVTIPTMVVTWMGAGIGTGIGIVVAVIGEIIAEAIGAIFDLFKSEEQKEKKAIDKIYQKLSEKINQEKEQIINRSRQKLDAYANLVNQELDVYFRDLIEGLKSMILQLETAKNQLEGSINYLNAAYAQRIIDWGMKIYQPLKEKRIRKNIVKVKRICGKIIKIETKQNAKLKMSLDEMIHILQEDLEIHSIKN